MGLVHSTKSVVRDNSLIIYWDPKNLRYGKAKELVDDREVDSVGTSNRQINRDSRIATTSASAQEYGSTAPEPGTGYSINAWVKRTDVTTGNWDTIATFDNGGPRFRQMWFGWYYNQTSRIHFSMPYYNGNAGADPPSNNDGAATYWSVDPFFSEAGLDFNIGQWYNFSMTYDNKTRIAKTYVNGVYARQGTRPGLGDLNEPNNAPLRMYGTDGPSRNSELGLFMVYNRAITALEVEENYHAFKGRFGY